MATGRTYGGKEYTVILGIHDLSAAALGTATADASALTKCSFRVNTPVNDVAWDAGYTRAEIERAGARAFRAEDIINPYKGGIWTWDFEWVVDNEVMFQNLLNLIYPSSTTAAAHGTGLVIPANPLVDDMKHGIATATAQDPCAVILIKGATGTADDRYLHSAVLQNLTLSMDAGTNGGQLTCTGQFMTGYRPVIEDNAVAETAGTAHTASDCNLNLFDLATHTLGGDEVSLKSWTITINNNATRVGFQGSDGEADGYVRASRLDITGSLVAKADDTVQDMLVAHWQANVTQALSIIHTTAADFTLSLPAVNMSGFNMDKSDEGVFVEIPFTATSGADGGGNLCVIKSDTTD